MAGSNPYIQSSLIARAKQKYTITFVAPSGGAEEMKIEVDPAQAPSSGTGLEGSILDIALASGIDIDHACGGVCACSTCHIVVEEGLETCNEASDDENDQLEKAPGLSPRSRLGCQCVPNGTRNLRVSIPQWNRNLVRE